MGDVARSEFGSAAWLAAARDHILNGLAAADLSGIEYAFCCIYTDPPAHLLELGKAAIAWNVQIRDGRVSFDTESLERADFHLTADWASCRELGLIVRTAPGGSERVAALIEAGLASGKFRGNGLDRPGPACFEALELHDYLAVRTR